MLLKLVNCNMRVKKITAVVGKSVIYFSIWIFPVIPVFRFNFQNILKFHIQQLNSKRRLKKGENEKKSETL